MEKKIACILLPLFLFGCSKASTNTPAVSDQLPFKVTKVFPDAESKGAMDEAAQAWTLLNAKNFDKLETLAAQLRSSKKCNANGRWRLDDFYSGLSCSDQSSDERWESRLAILKEWIKSKPDSITARVALADALDAYAGKARGDGWADSVTASGWKLFGERLNEAQDCLNAAKSIPTKCPFYWTVQLNVALGLQVNRSQYNKIFYEAIEFAPDYFRPYDCRAIYLMPRWNGAEGELESYSEAMANKIGGDDGDMFYARIVWFIHRSASSSNVFKENNFSWPRVNRGFLVIEKRYPDSPAAIGEHAYLASCAGDVETTRDYLEKTGGKADLQAWGNVDNYIKVANWAFSQHAPSKSDLPEPARVGQIKLTGISGTPGHRLAIINNETFGKGDQLKVKIGGKFVMVHCLDVEEKSAVISIEGIDGTRELTMP